MHILLLPAIIVGLVTVHMVLMFRQKHTQFRGGGRTEDNVIGKPFFPVFMAKTTGYLFLITGVIALLGAFAQINPIWQFGPYEASRISYAVQPDWYMGFLDGALRIWPSWTFHSFGHTIPFEVLIPAVILPGAVFGLAYAWPAIERAWTKDSAAHNLLDRPSDRPKRTSAGVAVFTLLAMMFVASSTDVLANFFHVSLNTVLWVMRVAVPLSPFIAYPISYKICKELQGVHGAGKRKTVNVVTRSDDGEYLATPAPAYPDDHPAKPDPIEVPAYIHPVEPEPSERGVRTVER